MQQILQIIKLILPAAAALAFCLLPRQFRASTYFGVRVAKQQEEAKALKNIKTLYEVSAAVSGGILVLVNFFLQLWCDPALSDLLFILIAAAVVLFAGIFYAMAAKAVARYVARTAPDDMAGGNSAQQDGPLDLSFTEGRLCPSLWWYLLHGALIAACALMLYAMYDGISPYVTLWADFSGKAVWAVPKSPQALALPILVQVFLTLICFAVSVQIRTAPLRLKGVNAQKELERSRKRRALWSAYVCILAFVADLALYAYIHFMFLQPQYKGWAPVILYAVLILALAFTLLLAYLTREK